MAVVLEKCSRELLPPPGNTDAYTEEEEDRNEDLRVNIKKIYY